MNRVGVDCGLKETDTAEFEMRMDEHYVERERGRFILKEQPTTYQIVLHIWDPPSVPSGRIIGSFCMQVQHRRC